MAVLTLEKFIQFKFMAVLTLEKFIKLKFMAVLALEKFIQFFSKIFFLAAKPASIIISAVKRAFHL